ncbi:MAG: M14 family zinc carboxypeptidase [Bacteroidales bacterium]|nr:M14 family zinc carboxypeptidase [Bacteroidales bacterium]
MKCKSYIICLVLFLLLNSIPAFSQLQPGELGSKFFPDPDIEIPTPGFNKTEGFMNYSEMMGYINLQADKRSDIVKIVFIGESISGKKIPLVLVENESKNSKVKIWMQGGLHGNEPAGTESILMFINHLVEAKNIDSILRSISFAFVPMANIDGYEKQVRDNGNKADLNRDQVTLEQQESIYLKQAFSGFSPSVAIDFHEFRPFRKELDKFTGNKLCIAQDVLFLPSGNLNIPAQLRDLTNLVYLNDVKKKLGNNTITFDNYFVPDQDSNKINILRMGGDSPRSSSTSFGLTNTVSILFEIRGIGLDRNSYKRRVYSGYLIAQSIMETTLTNREKVLETVNASINETIKRTNPIVLDSKPLTYEGNMNFIDVKNLENISLDLQIQDAGRSQSVSTRKRPKAYLLLAENAPVVRKLQILGLEIDTLKSDLKIKTEVFKIVVSAKKSVADSSISVSVQTKVFPKGSFVISTAQKNANMAVSTLEPEMENGYFRYKMIKANSDGEIPVYRLLKDVKPGKRIK